MGCLDSEGINGGINAFTFLCKSLGELSLPRTLGCLRWSCLKPQFSELFVHLQLWRDSHPSFCCSLLPPSCFPGCVITTACRLKDKKNQNKTHKSPLQNQTKTRKRRVFLNEAIFLVLFSCNKLELV